MNILKPLHFVLLFTLIISSPPLSVLAKGLQTKDPVPVAWWKFNPENSRKVTDMVSMIRDSIQGNYKLVDGVEGKALKLDGFTTVIRRSSDKAPKISGSFACEAWIAAATYPWNWCPVIAQEKKEEAGFYFGIGPQGQAGLFVSVNGVWQKCETTD